MSEDPVKRAAWGSLSLASVTEAALALIEQDGVEALTMRSLASSLGVGRMSVYRHVDNKDALLAHVVEAVAFRILLADHPAEDWSEELRRIARDMRRQLTRYPGLAQVLLTAEPVGPSRRQLAERILAAFRRAGFTGDLLATYYLVYVDTLLGRIYREESGDFASRRRMTDLFGGTTENDRPTPILDDTSRYLAAVEPELLFEKALDALLAGFASHLKTSPSAAITT